MNSHCDFMESVGNKNEKIVALSGNPNVGKSTIFNALTGLSQHTGNWSGKTVTTAQGKYIHNDKKYIVTDLPGTYSLTANSADEEAARDFICFAKHDCVVIVADATCLERNLNLVVQIIQTSAKVVLCVNLLDEAEKKQIVINLGELSNKLGIPVVGTSARSKDGLVKLMDIIEKVSSNEYNSNEVKIEYNETIENAVKIIEPSIKTALSSLNTVPRSVPHKINSRWLSLQILTPNCSLFEALKTYLGFDICENKEVLQKLDELNVYLQQNNVSAQDLQDALVSETVLISERIYKDCVKLNDKNYTTRDRKIDKILTSKSAGIPLMLGLLGIIFWITVTGANYPSELLTQGFAWLEVHLGAFLNWIHTPPWLYGLLIDGVYCTLTWVISVMLPPMAIFFPLFTLLEDLGYLPRIAFNMDKYFKKACAHGKQALTMCMGFGCNACGVIGCRIIDSPRERLIAILTNVFVPCNGRFPPPTKRQFFICF